MPTIIDNITLKRNADGILGQNSLSYINFYKALKRYPDASKEKDCLSYINFYKALKLRCSA